jgi:hypothetical protein
MLLDRLHPNYVFTVLLLAGAALVIHRNAAALKVYLVPDSYTCS